MRLADVPASPRRKKGETCSVAKLRDSLDDDDLETLDGWLADRSMRSVEISYRLTEAGIGGPSSGTLARHRRGDCQCER